jgi:hypothetical protein
MGSGFDDWVYWHFFTIAINYYSSQSILTAESSLHSASRSTTALNDICLTNLSEESLYSSFGFSTHFEFLKSTAFNKCLAAAQKTLR